MYSIGVDFHKAYSHMTVMDAQGQVVRVGKVSNTVEAVQAFVAPYRDDAQAVLEDTRNWTVMYDMLEREVRAVYLAHPLKVRAIAEARIKTDRIDSKILAHLLRCDLLPTAYVRPREQRISQQILHQRMLLVRVRTMVKNRTHVLIDRQLDVREVAAQFSDLFGGAGLAWLRAVGLADIERRLVNAELALFEAVQERITVSDSLVRNLAAGYPRVRWVRTIPGFGRFFAVLVVHEIGTIRRLSTPEKLSAYAGLVPSVHAAGGQVFHGRLTKQGNKWLRGRSWRRCVLQWRPIRTCGGTTSACACGKDRIPPRWPRRGACYSLPIVYSARSPYRKPGSVTMRPRPRTALVNPLLAAG